MQPVTKAIGGLVKLRTLLIEKVHSGEDSYFVDCPRDDKGHCKPSGVTKPEPPKRIHTPKIEAPKPSKPIAGPAKPAPSSIAKPNIALATSQRGEASPKAPSTHKPPTEAKPTREAEARKPRQANQQRRQAFGEHGKVVVRQIQTTINNSNLTPENKEKYLKTTGNVLMRMSDTAHERLRAGMKEAIYYNSVGELAEGLIGSLDLPTPENRKWAEAVLAKVKSVDKDTLVIGGAHVIDTGAVHMDGDGNLIGRNFQGWYGIEKVATAEGFMPMN